MTAQRYITTERLDIYNLDSDLSEIEPKFVASGHGFCITIVG